MNKTKWFRLNLNVLLCQTICGVYLKPISLYSKMFALHKVAGNIEKKIEKNKHLMPHVLSWNHLFIYVCCYAQCWNIYNPVFKSVFPLSCQRRNVLIFEECNN